jgi:hypothetical protein
MRSDRTPYTAWQEGDLPWLRRRIRHARVTGSLARGLRRLTVQRFSRSPDNHDWGSLTKEDLARQGVTPGMPHGSPPPRAIAMPSAKSRPRRNRQGN